MTGFGRYENHQGDRKFTVEMKSVNHRYFDSNIKMPKKLSIFESAIRNLLKEYIQRGKVDIFITYEDFTETNVSLKYNENIAAEYVKYYQQLSEKFDLPNDIRASVIGRSPEVFTMEEQPVGLELKKKVGDYVEKGETLAVLHANDQEKAGQAEERFLRAYRFSETQPPKRPMIFGEI